MCLKEVKFQKGFKPIVFVNKLVISEKTASAKWNNQYLPVQAKFFLDRKRLSLIKIIMLRIISKISNAIPWIKANIKLIKLKTGSSDNLLLDITYKYLSITVSVKLNPIVLFETKNPIRFIDLGIVIDGIQTTIEIKINVKKTKYVFSFRFLECFLVENDLNFSISRFRSSSMTNNSNDLPIVR